MSFDDAAVRDLFSRLESKAMGTGVFRRVNFHEPKSAPATGLSLAMWVDTIEPFGAASGLTATSGYAVVFARAYGNMLTKPEDEIDPRLTSAMTTLMNTYSGDFNLGATVRGIDLLGMYGRKMSAQAGYLTIDSHVYRIMTLTIPVIVDDMWTQVA